METEIIKIDRERPDMEAFQKAGKILKEGGLVAFPTETVYGLGANALDEEASCKIYAAKGRPSDNPLIVHIARMEDLEKIVKRVPEEAVKLAERFWPGPMTLILEKNGRVPYGTTGGLETVAVRMPSDPIARELILQGGGYVAAPSANTSGRPSPTTARHVYEDMKGKIPLILDGGAVEIGLESTIVDLTDQIPTILRPGYITLEMIQDVLGKVQMDRGLIAADSGVRPKAPGMKYRHYAPKADMALVEGEPEAMAETICLLAGESLAQGKRVGVICTEETRHFYPESLIEKTVVRSMGQRAKEETIAHNLYAVLREFDELDVDCIYCEGFPRTELGQAIMNRLTKAAGHKIIQA